MNCWTKVAWCVRRCAVVWVLLCAGSGGLRADEPSQVVLLNGTVFDPIAGRLRPSERSSLRVGTSAPFPVRKYQETTGLLYQAGVPLRVGTDTPEPFVPPGFSLRQELELPVESGLSPAAALAAATTNNARALDQQDRLWTVSPG